jgi:hypothetical protein
MKRFIVCALLLLAGAARAQQPLPIEVDFRLGASVFHDNTGVAAQGLFHVPLNRAYDVQLGAGVWSHTADTAFNWDWSAGLRSCWDWGGCFFLGADYVQRVDAVNSSHTEWQWSFSYRFDHDRTSAHFFNGVAQWHISNAGTVAGNLGRNAFGFEFQCVHEVIVCLPGGSK